MATHNDFGIEGEAIAERYLTTKGYSILAKNYRFEKSEIDIIAKKENILIFVEVKARTDNRYGFPEEAISDKKKEKLMEGAEAYLLENNLQCPISFDVIAITKSANSMEIEHIVDAFF
jgi:putative endonuclease